MLATIAVFLPLVAAIIAGFGSKALGDRGAQWLTSGGMIGSAVFSWVLFFQYTGHHAPTDVITVLTWLDSGTLEASWSLRLDALSVTMMIVVTTVSACVHVYSIGYMSHDKSIPRFMAYLSFFTFAMLMLVTSDNLVQLFFGWEGVGVASYLLIGFWYEKPSANDANIKAFLVNRVGDFGFVLGIAACYMLFGTVEFEPLFAAAASAGDLYFTFLGTEMHAMTTVCLLLFIGAMGKSAQLGLHTWLPDAMEGPTPVSALIHAATMVTAGVFLTARMSPLFEMAPLALAFVCILGALTAIVAATIGFTQHDIKRVIAYSTMSQLGYMFFAAGVGAYSAAMFHLLTHAFFKALLFLGAGSVIHAMSDEQDMRRMGGIRKMIPVTYAMMLIGSLALMGVGIPGSPFGLAGFQSKDLVLEAAYAAGGVGLFAFWLGLAAAFLTAFYSMRLLFLTFFGTPRAGERVMAHVHESPQVMLIPLYVLAFGAIFSGFAFYESFAGDDYLEMFWAGAITVVGTDPVYKAHYVPFWVKASPVVVGLMGIALAYYAFFVNPAIRDQTSARFQSVYQLFLNKWYFDDLYQRVFVDNAWRLGGFFWKRGDEQTIDRFGPDGVAQTALKASGRVSLLQTGYVFHYAFAMVIGLTVLVTWFMISA